MAKRWNPLEVPEHAIIVYVRTPMELEDLADQMPHLASRNMARVFAALWRDAHQHRRIFPWALMLYKDDRDGVKYLIGTYTPSNVKRNLGPVGGATPEDARMEDKKVATKKKQGHGGEADPPAAGDPGHLRTGGDGGSAARDARPDRAGRRGGREQWKRRMI